MAKHWDYQGRELLATRKANSKRNTTCLWSCGSGQMTVTSWGSTPQMFVPSLEIKWVEAVAGWMKALYSGLICWSRSWNVNTTQRLCQGKEHIHDYSKSEAVHPKPSLVGKIMNEPISTFCLKDSRRSDKWRLRPFWIGRVAQAETEHKKWSAEPLWFYLVLKCGTLKRQGTRQGTGKVFCPRSEEKKRFFSENLGLIFLLWPSTEKCIAKNPKPDNQNNKTQGRFYNWQGGTGDNRPPRLSLKSRWWGCL